MVSFRRLALAALTLVWPVASDSSTTSTKGITDLANRLFDGHGDSFEFALTAHHDHWSRWNPPVNDKYTVKAAKKGKIRIEGTTLNALARGLRHYANDVLQIEDSWFVDTYKKPPKKLSAPKKSLSGQSVVPWRYNLNTVTFSYTFAWYKWEDWEKLLDWAALRGVNLQLAWVGFEKIFLDSFRELGLKDEDIMPFFSGPAFQSWNRFGNIQGSWGGKGDLPLKFIDQQFDLQKKIVARMVELGITPALPAFPGFVPTTIKKVRPNANVTQSPNWFSPAPDKYTRDLFLSPLDDTYSELQKLFISKQIEAFGNVTNVYTLDQFNELNPAAGDSGYLSGISSNTYAGLTEANPAAIWLLQGWLFYASRSFWTQPRIDAYLGGVKDPQGMLILDLYSEMNPQWQRTNSYSGKRWIWCMLHDFGGNMALEGRIPAITSGPINALAQSKSLVGFGLTPEGYEGNEIVYNVMLDQAWSSSALDAKSYVKDFATKRYSGVSKMPSEIYQAWDVLREKIYSNARSDIPQVPVATYQLRPALAGIVNRTGHFPHPTALHYDPKDLQNAWKLMLQASLRQVSLWSVPTFQLDFIDVTRQVLSNAFDPAYRELRSAYECEMSGSKELRADESNCDVEASGRKLLNILTTLDYILLPNKHFTLQNWVDNAKSLGSAAGNEDLFAFNARSQVTVWQVDATNLNDYAAKAWGGLIGSYYKGRWSIFVDALVSAAKNGSLDQNALTKNLQNFERNWQANGSSPAPQAKSSGDLKSVAQKLQKDFPDIFPKTK